jgi:hypothetical protein
MRTPGSKFILALLCTLCLAGCGATKGSSSSRGRTPPLAQIGEGVTLHGPHPGEELRVTLVSYTPNLSGTANDHPEFDYQFVAARVRLQNIGSVAYSGLPSRQLSISSTESQASKSAQLGEGSCADAFAREVRLAPGQSAEGCVPAQILVVSTPSSLRFAPFAGGSAAARWSLKRSHPAT